MQWNSSECPAALCLNASRWDTLHKFAAQTGVKLVFGLSYPTIQSQDFGIWNSSQAISLFQYSQAQGYNFSTTLYGFEVCCPTLLQ